MLVGFGKIKAFSIGVVNDKLWWNFVYTDQKLRSHWSTMNQGGTLIFVISWQASIMIPVIVRQNEGILGVLCLFEIRRATKCIDKEATTSRNFVTDRSRVHVRAKKTRRGSNARWLSRKTSYAVYSANKRSNLLPTLSSSFIVDIRLLGSRLFVHRESSRCLFLSRILSERVETINEDRRKDGVPGTRSESNLHLPPSSPGSIITRDS